jgi:hypothetical protein
MMAPWISSVICWNMWHSVAIFKAPSMRLNVLAHHMEMTLTEEELTAEPYSQAPLGFEPDECCSCW